MAKRLKRPRAPNSLAKLIGDIATGQVDDAQPDDGKKPAAVALGKLGGAIKSSKTTVLMTGKEIVGALKKATAVARPISPLVRLRSPIDDGVGWEGGQHGTQD